MAPAPKKNAVVVYTDGACSGNPGPGGWAWAVDVEHYATGFAAHTTNQRMEIQAAFEAVKALSAGPIEVVSDSTYVVNCFRQRWWQGWLARGWINSQRKPVANRDLWEPFVELVRERGTVVFRWVKGHGGDPMNELVDQLAVEAAQTGRGKTAGSAPRAEESAPDAIVILVCGSTGAGKTTYAQKLARDRGGVRFSIDEWMQTLFMADQTEIELEWMLERIERCERGIWSICSQLIALETVVVLDLGFTTRAHREKFRVLAGEAGARAAVHFVDVDADERRRRVAARNREKDPAVYAMHVTDEMFDFMEQRFEAPDATELRGGRRVLSKTR
jgi:ribonuclease HI